MEILCVFGIGSSVIGKFHGKLDLESFPNAAKRDSNFSASDRLTLSVPTNVCIDCFGIEKLKNSVETQALPNGPRQV